MGHELNKWQSREADTVIEVDLGDLDQAAFDRAREAIREGFQAAEAKIGKIKKDLGI
jgi:hypothetical protein